MKTAEEQMIDSLKQTKAAARKAHFDAGGTPDTWRMTERVLNGAKTKARKNKRACRGKQEGEDV